MKVKSDHRSKFANLSKFSNLSKKSGLQRDSNPWPPRYRCDALPTELWSHTLGGHGFRSPSLGASNYPIFVYGVFTDRSIFSLHLSRVQIPTGISVTNCNNKHGLMSRCGDDVDMFTWGRIVSSSQKRAHVDWNCLVRGKISKIEDITRWREDMNFMFEWQEQYLTSERSERVRYCSCHENIKFISSS